MLVRTANNDKRVDEDLLDLRIQHNAMVYVCYDRQGAQNPSSWLNDWELTDQWIQTTDQPASPMAVFSKPVAAGETITLGDNQQGGVTGAESNYFVVLQAEDGL